MPGVIETIATVVATFIVEGLVAIGVSSTFITVNAAIIGLTAVVEGLIYAGLSYVGAKAVSKAGHPDLGKTNFRQAIARRRKGYGWARIGGYYACFEAKKGKAHDVIAFHAGPIGGIHTWYAADDVAPLDGSGYVDMAAATAGDNRYGNQRTRLQWRLGADPETAYADLVTELPGIWTNDHRGDGIASFYQATQAVKESLQANVFPQGVPVMTLEASLTPVWDWRTHPSSPSTKAVSKNPVKNLVDYLTASLDDGGFGQDFARRIEPSLAYWTAAADECDALIAKIGGTEAKYEMGGFYDFDIHPADCILEFLKTFDGWMSEAGDGSLIIYAGKYYAPTITFTDDHIIDYNWQRGRNDEETVNELNIQFVNPELKYTLDDADPWRDEADIDERGGERTDTLDLRWVQRKTQARRLAKREMARRAAELRGTITTNLYGLRGLGERYLRVQISDIAALNDIVVEVEKVVIDLTNMTLKFHWIEADPNVDSWDPATEENNAADLGTPDVVDPDIDETPVVESVAVFFEFTAGDYEPRLQVTCEKPVRSDLDYVVRTKKTNGSSWTTGTPQEPVEVDSDSEYVTSGFVARNSNVDVEVAFSYPDGHLGPWSATETKDTTGGTGGNPTPGDPLDPGGGDPTWPGEVP